MYTTTMFNDAVRMNGMNAAGFCSTPGYIPSNNPMACTMLNSGLGTPGYNYNPLLNMSRACAPNVGWTYPQALTTGQTVTAINHLGHTVIGHVVCDACGTRLVTNHGCYAIHNYPNCVPFACIGTVSLVPQTVIGG